MFHAITFTFQRQNNCICRCCLCSLYSHRTRENQDVGCVCVASLISIVLNRMGAVIREKSVLVAYCVRSLVDTRSVLTGDLQQKKQG